MIPTTFGGSTTASPPIMIVILRQQLDYVIIDYGRANHTALDKSEVFLFQESIIYFRHTRHSGAPP
jgi:hypothetical protein